MAMYKLPIIAQSFTIIEADTLEDAINDINSGDPDIPGIDTTIVSNWEVDQWESFEINDIIIKDEDDNDLNIGDIMNHRNY